MPLSRRSFLRHLRRVFAGGLTVSAAGCGLLLHPERRGMPHSGRLDASVVILDAVGCIFFLVPGLIAFIVDFATGTIYLPADCYGQNASPANSGELTAVAVGTDELTKQRIETEIAQRTGRAVSLDGPDVRMRSIEQVDEYDTAAEELATTETYTPQRLALD